MVKHRLPKKMRPMSEAVGSLDTEMPLWCKLCCFKEVAAIMAIALKAYQTIDMARTSTVLKVYSSVFLCHNLDSSWRRRLPSQRPQSNKSKTQTCNPIPNGIFPNIAKEPVRCFEVSFFVVLRLICLCRSISKVEIRLRWTVMTM